MKRLAVFDFDETLVELPYDEDDELMQTVESLYNRTFDFKEHVVNKYFEAISNGDKTAILTNRNTKQEERIIEILKEKGIIFDIHLFMDQDRLKSNRLKTVVEYFDIIEYWDDKTKHLDDVRENIANVYTDKIFILNLVE
ncbi:hypothetical protein M0Q50_03015 [bacterium]|jgi:FMN phosphatase YigB (HAD superfamily)|nr:hypothetical protein [bacterium]